MAMVDVDGSAYWQTHTLSCLICLWVGGSVVSPENFIFFGKISENFRPISVKFSVFWSYTLIVA